MKGSIRAWHYLISDLITAIAGWGLIHFLLPDFIDSEFSVSTFYNTLFTTGFLWVPAGWLLLYYTSGSYRDIHKKSRISEAFNTLFLSLAGSMALLFILSVLNEDILYTYLKEWFLLLWLPHFVATLMGRMTVLQALKKQIIRRNIVFPTLLIGSGKSAYNTHKNTERNLRNTGYHYLGFLSFRNGENTGHHSIPLPHLGSDEQMEKLIQEHGVKLIILAPEPPEKDRLKQLLPTLISRDVEIKMIPSDVDLFTGAIRTENVYGLPLVEIRFGAMPYWQQHLKRLLDVVVSVTGLLVLAPFFLLIALLVKRSSEGPVLYRQERIGLKGKPFHIIKFRSMYTNAEMNGPALSSTNDQRITPWGRIMRKWRLDELPQLWNVLSGEMSLVGPRPERKFYIDQLASHTPYYSFLLKMKPGLTSWGMVQYGYAQNTREMLERLPYDLLYIESSSLLLDFKIMIHTVRIIFMGKGK